MEESVGKTEGVDLLGRFAPEAIKWHWTYFYKAESLTTWDNFLKTSNTNEIKRLYLTTQQSSTSENPHTIPFFI